MTTNRTIDQFTGEKSGAASLLDAYAQFDAERAEAGALRVENHRLHRNVEMLTRQLDAMHDTDIGEALTRNQELWAEVLELRAEKKRREGK